MEQIKHNPIQTVSDVVREFEKIKKGRQNSKYHRNYIATHVVEDFIKESLATLLSSIVERGEAEKITDAKSDDDMIVAAAHNNAIDEILTIIKSSME